MSVEQRRRQIDVLRAWLQRQLGDDAVIYHQNSATPLPKASEAERFSITVPVRDAIGLVWSRHWTGPVRSTEMVLIIVAIEGEGVVRTHGRTARRDIVVHYREAV